MVFDELFESLAGHDELDGLVDELERRGDLGSEPDVAEVERRAREAIEEPTSGEVLRTLDDVLSEPARGLDRIPTTRPRTGRTRRAPLEGAAGDLAGEALRLSPAERASLAREILGTIERSDAPSGPDDKLV